MGVVATLTPAIVSLRRNLFIVRGGGERHVKRQAPDQNPTFDNELQLQLTGRGLPLRLFTVIMLPIVRTLA